MVVHPLLRLLRERNLTQSALAEQAGVSKGHISDIIRGRRLPGREALQRMAVALGLSPGELLDVLVGASASPASRMPGPGDWAQSAKRDGMSQEAKAA